METIDRRNLEGPPRIAAEIGYPWIQRKAQRRLGPVPGWNDVLPKGCEVFVKNFSRESNEDDLYPIFSSVGIIYEMRLTMDLYGLNRGYGFVRYTCRESARRAVQELNGYQLPDGRRLVVMFSVDNSRLFVGRIPKTATKEDILHTFCALVPGIEDVIVYHDYWKRDLNRGFAFLQFKSHELAAAARRTIMPNPCTAMGRLTIDWALPEVPVDEEVLKRITTLHVRNLLLQTSSFALKELFDSAIHPDSVNFVKKCYDYAFVYFAKREDAERAMSMLQDALVDGVKMKIEWAKPFREHNNRWWMKRREKRFIKDLASIIGSIEKPITSGQNLPENDVEMAREHAVKSVLSDAYRDWFHADTSYDQTIWNRKEQSCVKNEGISYPLNETTALQDDLHHENVSCNYSSSSTAVSCAQTYNSAYSQPVSVSSICPPDCSYNNMCYHQYYSHSYESSISPPSPYIIRFDNHYYLGITHTLISINAAPINDQPEGLTITEITDESSKVGPCTVDLPVVDNEERLLLSGNVTSTVELPVDSKERSLHSGDVTSTEDLPIDNQEISLLSGDVTSTVENSALAHHCNTVWREVDTVWNQEVNLRYFCQRYGWPQPVYRVILTEQRCTYVSTVMLFTRSPFVPQTFTFYSGEFVEIIQARCHAASLALNFLNSNMVRLPFL